MLPKVPWVQLRTEMGQQGDIFHRRSKQTSPTHVLIIYCIPSTVVVNAAFFLASFLPSFFMGRVLHKRECRGGGNGIVFFQVFSVAYVDSINLDIAEKV